MTIGAEGPQEARSVRRSATGEPTGRRWRPWWAAAPVRVRAGYTVWTAAGLVLTLAGSVMSAAELFSPRNAGLAVIAITIVGFFVGMGIAQRRHPEVLDLPPRRFTAPVEALAYGAYFAGLGTWLALILMGHDDSWTPAVVSSSAPRCASRWPSPLTGSGPARKRTLTLSSAQSTSSPSGSRVASVLYYPSGPGC